jgi:hypothetical protein
MSILYFELQGSSPKLITLIDAKHIRENIGLL